MNPNRKPFTRKHNTPAQSGNKANNNQEGVFPGQYGAARIFYYNSLMRRYLRVPQVSAVMGSCIAGGAYLPALSDVIFMVDGTSFMGLGGPNLVKGATGQTIDGETLGGARTHTEISAVAHYRAANDAECLQRIRDYVGRLPRTGGVQHARTKSVAAARPAGDLYALLPQDHRMSYDARQVLECLLDGGRLDGGDGGGGTVAGATASRRVAPTTRTAPMPMMNSGPR